jgi:hypothetical protein
MIARHRIGKVTLLLLFPREPGDTETIWAQRLYFADFRNSTMARCSWPVMLARRRM